MADNTIKIRRGVAGSLPTLEAGEFATTTDTHQAYFGDGTVNYELAKKTDKLSVFAATTSAELAGVISDEVGTGKVVYSDSPTFTTKITAPAILQTNAIQNKSKLLQTEDIFSDYVVTGLLPATSVNLTSNISAGRAYVTGVRVNNSATSKTYTASKDTYVDVNSAGTYTFTEVALGAAAPAIAADSIRLAKVVTDADNITGVTDLRTLSPNINVKNYGAVGNGSTDDTTAIQNAINVLSSGNILYFPKGTYKCSALLSFDSKSGITIIGEKGTILDFTTATASTNSLTFYNTSYIVIDGIEIDNSQKVAIIGSFTVAQIKNCIIKSASLQGINVQGTDVIVENNFIDTVTTEFGIVAGGTTAVNLHIRNNIIKNVSNSGAIQIAYVGSEIFIYNNTIYSSKYGIMVQSEAEGGLSNIKIYNNEIIGSTSYAIFTNITSPAVLNNIAIHNNMIIFTVGSSGIYIKNSNRVQIKDNYINCAGKTGYGIYIVSDNIGVDILGNYIYNSFQTINVNQDNVNIIGNRIDLVTYDAILLTTGNTFSNIKVYYNTFTQVGRDIIRSMYSANAYNVQNLNTKFGIGTVLPNGQLSLGQENGQQVFIHYLTELTTIAAAATTDTTIQIPANTIVLGVDVRVTVAIPTATTFTVTGATSTTTFNTVAVPVAVNTTNKGNLNCPYNNAAAQKIRITPNATPADTTGRVRVTIHYMDITPATS